MSSIQLNFKNLNKQRRHSKVALNDELKRFAIRNILNFEQSLGLSLIGDNPELILKLARKKNH